MDPFALFQINYATIFVLRIALIGLLSLVILRVVPIARRALSVAATETASAARTQKVVGHLVVVDSGSTPLIPGARLPIEPITTIGRAPTNTVVLDSGFVST